MRNFGSTEIVLQIIESSVSGLQNNIKNSAEEISV